MVRGGKAGGGFKDEGGSVEERTNRVGEKIFWKELTTSGSRNFWTLSGMSLPRPEPCFYLAWARNSGKSFFQNISSRSAQASQLSDFLALRRISSMRYINTPAAG